LHCVELLDDGVVFGERDVLEVDHDLVEGNVVIAAQLQLHLHGFDEQFVNTFVLDMELLLLVVETVHYGLQV